MVIWTLLSCFQLTDIVWGEAGETDDHIVPCQERSENYPSKKEWSQETTTKKSIETKKPGDNCFSQQFFHSYIPVSIVQI